MLFCSCSGICFIGILMSFFFYLRNIEWERPLLHPWNRRFCIIYHVLVWVQGIHPHGTSLCGAPLSFSPEVCSAHSCAPEVDGESYIVGSLQHWNEGHGFGWHCANMMPLKLQRLHGIPFVMRATSTVPAHNKSEQLFDLATQKILHTHG